MKSLCNTLKTFARVRVQGKEIMCKDTHTDVNPFKVIRNPQSVCFFFLQMRSCSDQILFMI